MSKLVSWFRDMKVAKKLLISFFVILIAAVSLLLGACRIKQLKRILNHKL